METAARRLVVLLVLMILSCGTAPGRTFLVFPFDESFTGDALDWVGEGIAQSLSDQLEEMGVGVIGRAARLELVESNDLPPSARLSRGTMIRVAQASGADVLVFGRCGGAEEGLEISLRTLDVASLRLGGEIAATGPLAALPQLENELVWRMLLHTGLDGGIPRERVAALTRKIPNPAWASYIRSFSAPSEKEQMRLLSAALADGAPFPAAHFYLGRLHYQNRQWPQAVSHLLHATGTGLSQWQRDFWLGNSLMQSGRFLEAIRALSPAAFLRQHPPALNNFGVTCLRIGEDTAASYAFAFAHARAPHDPTIAGNLALTRSLRGDSRTALAELEKTIPTYPESGMLHFIRGFLLRVNGDAGRAADAFDRAKNLGVSLEKLESPDPRSWSRPLLQEQPSGGGWGAAK